MADESVAPITLGQELGATAREPLVVEKARAAKNLQSLRPLPGAEAAAAQALIKPPFRQRTCEQALGRRKGPVPSELAAQAAEEGTLELEAPSKHQAAGRKSPGPEVLGRAESLS